VEGMHQLTSRATTGVIEVKAFGLSARGNDLWLETRQVDEARTNGRFRLYVVDNVRKGDPAD
jgi:hypothetical protein